jgi:hypothetical protein
MSESEETMQPGEAALVERSRVLFRASVEGLDMATRSRLTQARYAALEAAQRGRARQGSRMPLLAPAGVMAAGLLAVALWFGSPLGQHPSADQPTFEDLDIVAASEGPGDTLEMLQEDPDFYAWADKASNNEPEA